jgi:hypothetical protein
VRHLGSDEGGTIENGYQFRDGEWMEYEVTVDSDRAVERWNVKEFEPIVSSEPSPDCVSL